ncbi:MAG: (2Fe-2S)-binding protein [Myxococcales bacterium]|nr:(2Fe-2S)-binding protein [Myxococcales bacterium]
MIVCLCRGVSDRDVERAIAAGARSLEAVRAATGAGACCGACHPAIAERLGAAAQREAHARGAPPARRSLPVLAPARARGRGARLGARGVSARAGAPNKFLATSFR